MHFFLAWFLVLFITTSISAQGVAGLIDAVNSLETKLLRIIKNEKGGSSGLFRDGKGSTWEGGMHVPAIAYWKGKIEEGSVCQNPSSTLDLYHSFLKIVSFPFQ